MKTLEIFRILRQHRKLAIKRSIGHENQTKAKVLGYIGFSIMIIYMLFLAIMFALILHGHLPISGILGLHSFHLGHRRVFPFLGSTDTRTNGKALPSFADTEIHLRRLFSVSLNIQLGEHLVAYHASPFGHHEYRLPRKLGHRFAISPFVSVGVLHLLANLLADTHFP